ncbi:hypothetical protein BCR42DRAFT_5865 [Absidia repens]|uniref:Uncharacterized protein n=1 Tax=Absidia repens TaxID=90262 RepID=A0A1X2J0G8_9FUNG|nr:hypothetical protein BCR42DRAFT_5865 [Absidia repens]
MNAHHEKTPPRRYGSMSKEATITKNFIFIGHTDHFIFEKKKIDNSDLLKPTTNTTTSASTSSLPKSHGASISPNDDDQSLYLLWTHQLLVERGFTPSPMAAAAENDDASSTSSMSAENDDNEFSMLFSTPPSVSSPSYTNSTYMMGMDSSAKARSIASSTSSSSSSSSSSSLYSTFSFSSWFSYCFPK